ncbi:MAG: glycosyltransferase [Candidatus Micrarchaeia archaeon]
MPGLISVIIPTKNAGPSFEGLLSRLRFYKAVFEIIVVDSGSVDSTLHVARKHFCKIIQISPRSFSHGLVRNLGALKAKGSILVFLTQDALPVNDDWLSELVAPLGQKVVAGAFSRQIPFKRTNPSESFFLSVKYPKASRTNFPSKTPSSREVFFSNASSAIKKSVWKKIRFSKVLVSSEDQFWAKKVLTSGFQTRYVASSKVFHSHDFGLLGVFKRYFDSGSALSKIYAGSKESSLMLFLKFTQGFIGELFFLLKKHPFSLPYAFVYNFLKVAGLFCGKFHFLFPVFLKRRMSTVPYFWK